VLARIGHAMPAAAGVAAGFIGSGGHGGGILRSHQSTVLVAPVGPVAPAGRMQIGTHTAVGVVPVAPVAPIGGGHGSQPGRTNRGRRRPALVVALMLASGHGAQITEVEPVAPVAPVAPTGQGSGGLRQTRRGVVEPVAPVAGSRQTHSMRKRAATGFRGWARDPQIATQRRMTRLWRACGWRLVTAQTMRGVCFEALRAGELEAKAGIAMTSAATTATPTMRAGLVTTPG
jgi:hypothetical protein